MKKAYFHIVVRAFVALVDDDIATKTVTVPQNEVSEVLWHDLVRLCAKQLCEELELEPRDIEINQLEV